MADVKTIDFIVQGHRGVRSLDESNHPENTFPAFSEALQLHCEVELDLQITKDLDWIIYHDTTLQPENFTELNGEKIICEYNVSELSQLHFSSHKDQKLPALGDLLNRIKTDFPEAILDFEIKYDKKVAKFISTEELAKHVVETIPKLWPIQQMRIRSFNPEIMYMVKTLNPNIETVMLTWTGPIDYEDLLDLTKANHLAPLIGHIEISTVQKLRSMGYKVIPYAVQGHGDLDLTETPEFYQFLFENFDGFTTDSPRKLIASARQLGFRLGNRQSNPTHH